MAAMPARPRLRSLVLVAALGLAAACSGDDTPSTEGLSEEAARGAELVRENGCLSCHRTSADRAAGPGWAGWPAASGLSDGTTVVADAEYLRRSILDPSAQIVAGFANAMPRFELSDEDVDAIVAYLESLADG